MVRKKTSSEMELAEIKLQSLRERRDALNALAASARKERDLLNEEKRQLGAKARDLRTRRAEFVREMRAHRGERNRLQAEARQLIELKRKSRGRVGTSVSSDLERLRSEARGMEMRQQTASLTIAEENKLIGDLKATLRAARELETLKAEQDAVSKEVRDLDAAIDDRFRRAEAEHQLVVALGAQADAAHAEIEALVPQIAQIAAEADRKHAEFLARRAKADELHAKSLEMRERIITIRGEQRSEIRESREALRQQSIVVRRALLDDRKLDEAADEAVEKLLRGGRVEIKG